MDPAAIGALLTQLVREGWISDETVHAAADECAAIGNDAAAHQLRLLIVQAGMRTAVERTKDLRRASLTVLDGGNTE